MRARIILRAQRAIRVGGRPLKLIVRRHEATPLHRAGVRCSVSPSGRNSYAAGVVAGSLKFEAHQKLLCELGAGERIG